MYVCYINIAFTFIPYLVMGLSAEFLALGASFKTEASHRRKAWPFF